MPSSKFRNLQLAVGKLRVRSSPSSTSPAWHSAGVALFLIFAAFTCLADGPVPGSFAWSENVGWINFAPQYSEVSITPDGLSGFVWAENVGWIKLGSDAGPPYANTTSTDWGVNNDGSGTLSGFAWSETAGWIKFDPVHGGVYVDEASQSVIGFAWSENLGWIHLSHAPVYGVSLAVFADGFEN